MNAAGVVEGIGAAPGRALGRVHRLQIELPEVPHRTIRQDEVDAEIERFERARTAARERLERLVEEAGDRLGPFEGKMFEAQAWMVDDPLIVEGTIAYIGENYLSAERAFDLQILEHRAKMLDSGQSMVLDRLSDLQDVRLRVLSVLLGLPEPELPEAAEEPLILVARDLPPSMAVRLDASRVAGFVTVHGSRGGHATVIARSLGIPAVVGASAALEALSQGDLVLVDGRTGRIVIEPSDREIAAYRKGRARVEARREARRTDGDGLPTHTKDGVRVVVQANIDRPDEVARAIALGAEGVGLFRSEFLVIGHREIPSEAEQYEAYRQAVDAAEGHEVVLRTFDIGGDKFPMFLTMPREENPYLGWRAIRVCLDLPDLFLNQLRAAVRASAHGNLRILLPFVVSLSEIERTREMLDRVCREPGFDLPDSRPPLGIMIETPAAVDQLDRIAPLVDFVSLGTNDLTQYVLAADRGNARLAGLFDAMHPALIAQYRRVVASCRAHDLELGICGELAAEPAGLALLVGLGFRRFSMSLSALAEQREVLGRVSAAALAAIVGEGDWPDGDATRAELSEYLAECGVLEGDRARLSSE